MLTVVNSVDTQAAILTVLTARKNPFILSLVAKQGITEVAKFAMARFEHRDIAEHEMYSNFELIWSYESVRDAKSYLPVYKYMRVVEDLFGDCAFSVVVERMEI